MEKVGVFFKTFIGGIVSFFGVLAIPLMLLVPCNLIDYFTGMAASKVKGEKINSKRGFQGIVKKISMYILIFVGFGIDCMVEYAMTNFNIDFHLPNLFAALIASWLVINELISITENCETMGVKLPIIAPVLKLIKKKLEISADVSKEEKSIEK